MLSLEGINIESVNPSELVNRLKTPINGDVTTTVAPSRLDPEEVTLTRKFSMYSSLKLYNSPTTIIYNATQIVPEKLAIAISNPLLPKSPNVVPDPSSIG